jgi:hypothetical protein
VFDTLEAVHDDATLAHAPAMAPLDLGLARGFPGGLHLQAPQGLPVHPALSSLFPYGMLRRGSVLGITGQNGSIALLLALISELTARGSWAAVVGLPDLGIEAAAALGIPLHRLALVPDPGARWPETVGVLLDALDLVALGAPPICRATDARRLAARARERRSVLVVVTPPAIAVTPAATPTRQPPICSRPTQAARWPEPVDLQLQVTSATWEGLAAGDSTLLRRQVTVRSSGRRSAGQERTVRLWLPTSEGDLAATDQVQPWTTDQVQPWTTDQPQPQTDPAASHPPCRGGTGAHHGQHQPPVANRPGPAQHPVAG